MRKGGKRAGPREIDQAQLNLVDVSVSIRGGPGKSMDRVRVTRLFEDLCGMSDKQRSNQVCDDFGGFVLGVGD